MSDVLNLTFVSDNNKEIVSDWPSVVNIIHNYVMLSLNPANSGILSTKQGFTTLGNQILGPENNQNLVEEHSWKVLPISLFFHEWLALRKHETKRIQGQIELQILHFHNFY